MSGPFGTLAAEPTLGLLATYLKRGIAPDYVDDGIPVLSQAVNQASGFDWGRARNHRSRGGQREESSYLRDHDVVINSTGTGTLGRVGYFVGGSPAVADSHVTVLRVNEDLASPRFVYWALSTDEIHRWLNEVLAVGATNQIELNPDRLAGLRLPHPDIGEQRRIADYLDEQDRLLAQIVALHIDEGLALKERHSNWAASQFDLSRAAMLKRRWQVIDCKHRTPEYVDSGFPVVSPGDVKPGVLDLAACHRFVSEEDFSDLADDLRRCMPGDLVYARNASVGAAAYVATSQPFTMGQDVCRITSEAESQRFLGYFLNLVAMHQIEAVQVGSTFKRINIEMIKELRVPDISRARQDQVAKLIQEEEQIQERLLGQIARAREILTQRRQAVVSAAVTGMLDVTTASRKVA